MGKEGNGRATWECGCPLRDIVTASIPPPIAKAEAVGMGLSTAITWTASKIHQVLNRSGSGSLPKPQ